MSYRAPLDDMLFALRLAAGDGALGANGLYADLGDGVAEATLAEAAKFAQEQLLPLDRIGDRAGARFFEGAVTTPPGWRDAYAQWIAGGWNSLAAAPEHGGLGLPAILNAACTEIWNGANMAFALCPLLGQGAIEAIEAHASDALKEVYLGRLISGEWTATMNLTEPQAGSDLSLLRARAERNDDGSYRLFGQKIFITYGEHDLSDNIVHLVLARLPGAPAGTRGISLFLAPKFLPDASGGFTRRNDLRCAGIEHKLGVNGSPTCTMVYGDARRRDRFSRRRGKQGPRLHVHDDEQCEAGRRPPGRRAGRAGDAAGARLCARAPAGAGRKRRGSGADRRTSRRGAHVFDHDRADPGRARDLLRNGCFARPGQARGRSGGGVAGAGAGGPADAGRQGLFHRHRQ